MMEQTHLAPARGQPIDKVGSRPSTHKDGLWQTPSRSAALVRKRAELAGEIEALEAKLRGLWESLEHVDATILLFDHAHDLAGIKPKKLAYDAGPFMHGELSRLILDALRPATEPMSVTEIAAAIIR